MWPLFYLHSHIQFETIHDHPKNSSCFITMKKKIDWKKTIFKANFIQKKTFEIVVKLFYTTIEPHDMQISNHNQNEYK